jgi:hypothetical protein
MASDRPYRRALELESILEELKKNAGTQFDPQVVRAFEEITTQAGSSLVINSARKGVNLRLQTDLDEIYHNLLKDRIEEKIESEDKLEGDAIQQSMTPGLFSFKTLPRQNMPSRSPVQER